MTEHLLSSVGRIWWEARAREIEVAVITQQAQSGIKKRDEMRKLTYAEEVRLIREQLEREGVIGSGGL